MTGCARVIRPVAGGPGDAADLDAAVEARFAFIDRTVAATTTHVGRFR